MFEKANPVSAAFRPPFRRRTDEAARLRPSGGGVGGGVGGALGTERFEPRTGRRAGDALRAVEWSEITARLNAARDLRLLLRSESEGRIEAVEGSFGDAAASYFAMIDDNEPDVNLETLDRSKVEDGMECTLSASGRAGASQDDAIGATGAPLAMQETGND